MTPMFYFNRAIDESDGDESKSVQGIVKQQKDGSWFVLLDVVKGDRDGSDGSPPIATPVIPSAGVRPCQIAKW